MINYKIDGINYPIKTKWEDVPFELYAELKNPQAGEMKLTDRLSKLSGIPKETTLRLSIPQALEIFRHLEFMEGDLTEFKKVEPEWIYKKLNAYNELQENKVSSIGMDSWYKLEKSKQIFSANENPYIAISKVIQEYLGKDITKEPITECYGYVDFFLHSSTNFLIGSNG